jgi:hypothetical protein
MITKAASRQIEKGGKHISDSAFKLQAPLGVDYQTPGLKWWFLVRVRVTKSES